MLIRYLMCAVLLGAQIQGASFHRSRSTRSNVSLRKRLHVNNLITEPGTVEIDLDYLYSYTSANYGLPSTIKYTPEGQHILWGQTEYSVAFDSVDGVPLEGERSVQFSDRLSFTATSVVFDSEKFDIAIAPQATFFLRDESGARLGATLIARWDLSGNSIGCTATWTGATSPSANNPAGTWDFGGGYGHKLASHGVLGHFTPHVNAVFEKSTGFAHNVSAFGGVEYQMTERVALDVSGQRLGWFGGGADRQFLAGMTINLGKMH